MPVFLPTTLQGAEQIIQTINELKNKVPSDPLEAGLLAMADMIKEDQTPGVGLIFFLCLKVSDVQKKSHTGTSIKKFSQILNKAANNDSEHLPDCVFQMWSQ